MEKTKEVIIDGQDGFEGYSIGKIEDKSLDMMLGRVSLEEFLINNNLFAWDREEDILKRSRDLELLRHFSSEFFRYFSLVE